MEETEVLLTSHEMEALRLADLEGFYRDDAASRMQLTPGSFAGLLRSAHQKVAQALCAGGCVKAGEVPLSPSQFRTYRCDYCDRVWQLPRLAGVPSECPRCHGGQFHMQS